MKKLFVFAVLTVISFTALNAQNTRFGIKAGVNFSQISVDANEFGSANSDSRTGFFVGGVADIEVSEKFHVQPELLFSSEGGDNVPYNYINVPIIAKYYVAEGFNIQAGPQLGYLVSVDGETDLEGANRLGFSLDMGIGYDINENFFAVVRYDLGLSNLIDDSSIDAKQNSFQIGVGYRFN
ncbi:MAG: PorT family protein [Flavobacteriaceae bacterium]|nr:PorT family protein [Flavobacteriaceae bacterium]